MHIDQNLYRPHNRARNRRTLFLLSLCVGSFAGAFIVARFGYPTMTLQNAMFTLDRLTLCETALGLRTEYLERSKFIVALIFFSFVFKYPPSPLYYYLHSLGTPIFQIFTFSEITITVCMPPFIPVDEFIVAFIHVLAFLRIIAVFVPIVIVNCRLV